MRRFKRQFETYTGQDAESDAMLPVSKEAVFAGEYKNFRESLIEVLKNQPSGWDPEDPPIKPSPFPSEIHFLVRETLEEQLGTDEFDLKFFTASGSAFDKLHGVDALFTLKSSDTPEVYVTLDATINPKKAERGHKANTILLFPENFFDEEQTTVKDREKIETKWAEEISEILKGELNAAEQGNRRAQIVPQAA